MAEVSLSPLPPEEALAFFRAKGYRPSFDWRDVWQEEHGRAFTVAKVMRYDLLQDIRQAVDAALAEGITFQQFRERLEPTLRAKGWWGRAEMTDPATGEVRRVQLGSPRRLQIIYDTNLRAARSAGRWEAIQRLKRRRPWLRYQAVLDSRTRPQHRAWHGTILPVDHDWWKTHYPPNGWRCRCIVQQLSDRDLRRYGLKPSERPPAVPERDYVNRRTGEVIRVPQGVDPGFAYNMGMSSLRALTPRPLPGRLRTPTGNPPADLPLPPARTVPASELLPPDTTSEEAMDEFLRMFGADRNRPAVIEDRISEPLVVSTDFFFRDTGQLKLVGTTRITATRLMARTITDPDEIWWQWERHEKTNEWRLRRRYLARFNVEGQKDAAVMIVFDVGKDGWVGVTAFRARNSSYLEQHRAGTLAYRRDEEE